MRLVKGEEFINTAKSGQGSKQLLMQTPAVMAVLNQGFDAKTVQQAVDMLKKENGSDFLITAQKILETIYKKEDTVSSFTEMFNQPVIATVVERLQKENESLKDKQLCKVCMEEEVEVIFFPCKHFVCCAACATGLSVCPICRKQIASLDKVYMS